VACSEPGRAHVMVAPRPLPNILRHTASPKYPYKPSEKPRRGLRRSLAGHQMGGLSVYFAIRIAAKFTIGGSANPRGVSQEADAARRSRQLSWAAYHKNASLGLALCEAEARENQWWFDRWA
jgi:hypothetical protein